MAAKFDANPATLTRFILTEQKKHAEATGDFSILLSAIAVACKSITSAVRRAGLTNLYGLHGSSNTSGDDQKKLDVISNDCMVNALRATRRVAAIVSEELDEAVIIPAEEGGADAHYIVATDPLDGSSNIDCNVSVGAIFSILRRPEVGKVATVADALQPGTKVICAGYAMFGSSTQLVLAMPGSGCHIFTLDPTIGEFLLTHRDVRIPDKPQRIYSLNEGNYASLPPGVQRFVDECKRGEKPYSLRYVGSMVADVHRTLLYGGIFLYPATASAPDGKLRLLYECIPMALILEEAGGMADTGRGRLLDVVPTKIHQRSPLILGCKRDVDTVLGYLRDDAAAAAAGGAGGGAAGGAGSSGAAKP